VPAACLGTGALPHRGAKHCAAVTKGEGQKKKNRSLPLLDLILINAAVGGTWDATLYSLLSRAHRS